MFFWIVHVINRYWKEMTKHSAWKFSKLLQLVQLGRKGCIAASPQTTRTMNHEERSGFKDFSLLLPQRPPVEDFEAEEEDTSLYHQRFALLTAKSAQYMMPFDLCQSNL
ncbi:hypothetical protein EJB05_47976, partial [Eragrostis curvula]